MTEPKLTILLAEDNKANQFISKAMIETVGAKVLVAENGHETLQLVDDNHVDMILMDCQMPEMDGLEATRRLRADKDARKNSIPIIALTADAQKDTRNECLATGMNDFLRKPFTFDDLKLVLAKWGPASG